MTTKSRGRPGTTSHQRPSPPSIGRRIKEVREACEATIREVAVRGDVAESRVVRVETEWNDNPTYKLICAIAKGIGVPPSILLEVEGTPLKR